MFNVEVKNLTKRFGSRPVLNNISFSHHTGVLGIAGANGSGKSTLLKCLSGLLGFTSGAVTWREGEKILAQKKLRTHLGYVAPYINLYHELTVSENIELILQLRKHSCGNEKIEEELSRSQLSAIKNQPFGELSTGQQQRARLACTLVYDPPVLFLDEPGASLDEKGKASIRNILDDFRNREKLILLASNNQEELDLADRILELLIC